MRSAKIHYFIDKLCTSALGTGGSPQFPPVVKLALNEYFDSREHKDPPVACAVRAGVVHPHDDEDMLKVRADDLGSEGMSAGLLEHDGHDVVAYVPLPQQLVVKEQGAPISGTLQTFIMWTSSRASFPAEGLRVELSILTCCLLLGVYGSRVDTWNMSS